jgi:protein associated with RNAse G/E
MKQTWFVIVANPQEQVAPGTCYIAQDASPTMMRSNAVRFSSFTDVHEFADENRIALNAQTYIDLIIQGRVRGDR